MNINNLNDDCLLEVFNYLSNLDKLKSALVCKKWAYYLLGRLEITDKLLKEFTEDNSVIKKPRERHFTKLIFKILKTGGSFVNTLKFEGDLNIVGFSKINKFVSKYCKNITNLSLCGISDTKSLWVTRLDILFKNLVHLRCLKLKYLFVTADSTDFFSTLKAHNIEEFEMIEVGFDSGDLSFEFLTQLKNVKMFFMDYHQSLLVLQQLNKSDCKGITDFAIYDQDDKTSEVANELSNILVRQKNLRKIDLSNIRVDENFLNNVPKMNMEFLELDIECCLPNYSFCEFHNLKELKCIIREDIKFSDEVINGITDCKSLKQLELTVWGDYALTKVGETYFCKLINLEFFKIEGSQKNIDNILTSLSQCVNLKRIIIPHCEFSQIGINSLSFLPNLIDLDISYCEQVTDLQLIHLVKNLLKLEKIDIRGCENVTNKIVEVASEIKNMRQDKHCLTITYKSSGTRHTKINLEHLINISSLIKLI